MNLHLSNANSILVGILSLHHGRGEDAPFWWSKSTVSGSVFSQA